MNNLLWILGSDKSSSFGNKGVSGSYIIPHGDLFVDPKSVAGGRVWVILRGIEDRLLKIIKVNRIEKIVDGYNSGDYLLTTDLSESLKSASSYSEAGRYKVTCVTNVEYGMRETTTEVANDLIRAVKGAIQVKLIAPSERLLSQVDLNIIPSGVQRIARNAMRAVISRLTLDQIWASGTGEKLGAFPHFTYSLISRYLNNSSARLAIDELKKLDPIYRLTLPEEIIEPNVSKATASPRVDVDFSEIEPEKIHARTFLSLDSKLIDLEAMLNKTEHAEKIHQDMLKDISMYLLSRGVTPYESSSIDLMYRSTTGLNVLEIKSTTSANIMAQSAKGSFQLACYYNELIRDYEDINTFLVLHKTENENIETFAWAALSRLGVSVLIYNPNNAWPKRIDGLPV